MLQFKPEGRPTVIPWIFTKNVADVVGFMASVFGAEGEVPPGAPADMRIGESVVMVSDGGGVREPQPACLYVYVENTDEAVRRAVAAGARIIDEPADMPWGDRRATVEDPWGNSWQIATMIAG
jgi:PhnB protein